MAAEKYTWAARADAGDLLSVVSAASQLTLASEDFLCGLRRPDHFVAWDFDRTRGLLLCSVILTGGAQGRPAEVA
jgi:hypothetical protein